ncbi:MAG: hypothetical protein ACLQVI_39530 [Polyangiaceae bacterium]
MWLGMTHGEAGLVVFVFVLVYAAQLAPKLGERVGAWLSRKR